MMRLIFTILLFYLFIGGTAKDVAAQILQKEQQYTDSIKNLVKKARKDTAKASLFNQLSDYWSEKDSGKAIGYAHRALQLSQGHPFYVAKAHFYMGGAYFYNNATKSKKEYQLVIDLLKKDSSRRALILISRSWHNYGALEQRAGDDKSLLKILLNRCIPLIQKAKDSSRLAACYADVGMIFGNILNYKKAIQYYNKAITIRRKIPGESEKMASYYNRIAKNYLYQDQNNPAKKALDSSFSILKPFHRSFEFAEYYLVSGMYYLNTRQWKAAFLHLDSSLSIAKHIHLPYLASSALFQKYKGYKETKNYSQAKKVLLKEYQDSLTISKLSNKQLILYNLAQTEAEMGQMKNAYDWLLRYSVLTDSLHSKELKSSISELEIKYNSEKKQRKILTLQNQNKQQKLQLQKKRFLNYILIASLTILLLLSLLIYLLYRNKKRKIRLKEEWHQQEMEQMAKDQQLKVYNAMLEGQEQERSRMSRDLHDGLGGMLAGVKLKLSDIADHQQKTKDMELYKVIGQLDRSVQELRRIAHNMMPESLIRYGVETALQDLCDSLKTETVHIDFQSIQLSKNLSQSVQIAIYRIVQELLTNAIKHGNAGDILVQCSQNEDRIFMTVEDDGKGFDVKLLEKENGIGIANIRKRIDYLKGQIDIDSEPGSGTVVNVEVNAYE